MNNSSDSGDLIDLGIVGRPQGLRGEVRVNPIDIGPRELERLTTDRLFFRPPGPGELRELRLTEFRFHGNVWVVALEGFESREDAEELRGGVIAVPREDLWELEENEYFELDLIGLEAFDEKTGEKLGEVQGLARIPSDPPLVVKHFDGHEFLVPMVSAIVKRVDLEARKIWLDLPEGLIELNQ